MIIHAYTYTLEYQLMHPDTYKHAHTHTHTHTYQLLYTITASLLWNP
jgi:hypothetical protein